MGQAITQVGVYQAKAEFSELIRRVAAGERIVITIHGKPAIELVAMDEAVNAATARRQLAADRLLAGIPRPSHGGVSNAEIKRSAEEGRR